MAGKQKLNRLKKHAKKRGKEGYNGRWHIETSNGDQPFNNVEERLKISTLTVYNMPQNRSHTSQKSHARKMAYKRVMKQVQ